MIEASFLLSAKWPTSLLVTLCVGDCSATAEEIEGNVAPAEKACLVLSFSLVLLEVS